MQMSMVKSGLKGLLEGLTASPVMHASQVRAPLILRGVFRDISETVYGAIEQYIIYIYIYIYVSEFIQQYVYNLCASI